MCPSQRLNTAEIKQERYLFIPKTDKISPGLKIAERVVIEFAEWEKRTFGLPATSGNSQAQE